MAPLPAPKVPLLAPMAPLSALMAEPVTPCAGTRYMPPGFPILVPKRHGGHFIFCTHDVGLFNDFLANGFCHMTEHPPETVFSSPIIYSCPSREALAPRWGLSDVGSVLLEFGLPVVVAAGFVLGCLCALRHARLDKTRRVPLYPRGPARRAALVLACGLVVAATALPWLVWLAGVLAYGAVAFVVWPFWGAAMFHTLPAHPLQFWAPFVPLARRARELLGGVGDVRLARRRSAGTVVVAAAVAPRAPLFGPTEPQEVYVYTRRSRRERRSRKKHCVTVREVTK
ncbi:hypothetical protein GGTG_09154 [Gaeumannomyces tritici R3-111a-1]|uniref:Uncharacterized protein n=1 Tax=Gaeumannomyces tritici (strain R3-111a-1) TaxID=644352 RepID=J3P6L2_GAET3|nr:hypothetical protein GGTG_09154 [Gaeumannomyces tritici R3-111a-1]EJT72288.1 hypothetical protein GGTG_09154 [Gaeumannomyces tritici R3-111a-1]